MSRGLRKTDTSVKNIVGEEPENKASEITLKNKKSEILDALHAALERERERTISHYNPELEAEYNRGRAEATRELEKEHKYAETIMKKDYQSTIDRQSDKIKSLENELKISLSDKQILQEKLDRAYAEIKDMATKTVESTGGVKILGSDRTE